MKSLKFEVQGSSPIPYVVTFVRTDSNLSSYCTCPAGSNGQLCKHRLRLLDGNNEGVITNNEQISLISEWLRGSPLEAALLDLKEAEAALEIAKKNMSIAKNNVNAVMIKR